MKSKTLKSIIWGMGALIVYAGIYILSDQFYNKKAENLINNAPVITTQWNNSPDGYLWGFFSSEEPYTKVLGMYLLAKTSTTWDLYQQRVKELNKEKSLDGTVKVLDLDGDGKVGLEDK